MQATNEWEILLAVMVTLGALVTLLSLGYW